MRTVSDTLDPGARIAGRLGWVASAWRRRDLTPHPIRPTEPRGLSLALWQPVSPVDGTCSDDSLMQTRWQLRAEQ
jgi:hypothetical protein